MSSGHLGALGVPGEHLALQEWGKYTHPLRSTPEPSGAVGFRLVLQEGWEHCNYCGRNPLWSLLEWTGEQGVPGSTWISRYGTNVSY